MSRDQLLERIEINPKILTGKPVIKGTRLSVQFIVGLLAQGTTFQEILDEYSNLKQEDILACLWFASQVLESNTFIPLDKSA
jgi:uncharacterized protein (DUF433 family)